MAINSHAALITLLEDEFRDYKNQVRIRPVFPADTTRSPDLEQDYDPEHSDLHRKSGVFVQTQRHQYFAPTAWIEQKQYSELTDLIQKIRNQLLSKN